MREVRADLGAELAEFNGEPEHVHLVVNFPPTVAIFCLVNSPNGVPSRRLQQEYPDLRCRYRRAKRLWSRSHFAGGWAAWPFSCCARTSSSRTGHSDLLTSGRL